MNPDWEKFGRDIQHIVEDAVNSQNFSQLNKTITSAVNEAAKNVRRGLQSAGAAANKEWNRESYRWYGQKKDLYSMPAEQKTELPTKKLFRRNTGVKIGGTALTICGCTLNVGLGLAVIILCLVSLVIGSFPIGVRIALSILVPFLIGSAILTGAGSYMLSALKRYHIYIGGLRGKTYCNLKELAQISGKSVSYVAKDVRKMIDKGWFLQGHLDEDETCLIVSHETFKEYEEIKRQRRLQEISEQQKQNNDVTEADKALKNETLEKVMDKGQEYIAKIRACNTAISEAEISGKISHMEMLIQKIFDRVGENPQSLEDISKMMEYYLPTTVKLLDAYRNLSAQPVQGENIQSSKAEIEQTLDTLNGAFENLLDSLFEDVAWDVSSDISVLQTMLAQEGLTSGKDWERTQVKK